MCRLEDMRHILYDEMHRQWLYEVNERGTPINLVRMDGHAPGILAAAPLYRCECGQEFNTWQEAKDHIDWGDNQRPS